MNTFYLPALLILTTLLWSCNTDTKVKVDNHSTTSTISAKDKDDLLIAYNVLVDPTTNNYDIFVTDLEGNTHTNIAKHDWLDWVYSSCKNQLFVVSDRDTCEQCYFLYETDASGSYWNKVSSTQIQDSWVDHKNDGQELIIKPAGSPNTPFQIIDRKGKVLREVDPEMAYFMDPCFSTNGNSIVYRGYDGAAKNANKAELYLYNLNTKSNTRLTHYPENAKTFGQYQYHAGPARWNDKLDLISYSSSYDGKSLIKSVTAIGEDKRKLTQSNVKAVWHDISPDGEWITFDGQLDFKSDSATTQIFIMNFDKRSTTSLTRGSGYKHGPVFVQSSK